MKNRLGKRSPSYSPPRTRRNYKKKRSEAAISSKEQIESPKRTYPSKKKLFPAATKHSTAKSRREPSVIVDEVADLSPEEKAAIKRVEKAEKRSSSLTAASL